LRLTPIQIINIAKQHPSLEGLSTEKMTQFNNTVDRLGLTNIYYKKPLIDGKTLCQMYEVQPGKIMKPLLEELNKF